MTPNAAAFASTKPDSTSVVTASGKHLRSIGRGTVTLQINSPNPGILALLDVLLVPELEFSLISVYKLNEDHLHVEFTEHLEAVISDPFQRDFIVSAPWSAASQAYLILAIGDTERSKASALVTTTNEERSGTQLSQRDLQEILWHERTGHMGKTRLPLLYEVSRGLPELLAKRYHLSNSQCWVCYLTNLRRLPFLNSTTKSTRALELVHADLTGRIIVKSFGGAEYLAILVDDFTRMVWVLPLAKKSDFVSAFIKWRDEVVPFKGSIACLRTDGGGEFVNSAIDVALSGARHERSCAYTAQQNGVAERYVGIVKNVMRPLIHGRQLPLEYWAEAALTAAYLRNRSPSAAIGGITPYELWHGTVPDLSHLRVFGCLAFSMLSDKAREHSLSVRSKVGVFVGYDKVQKGYRIHFPDTGELVVTRNVGFHEDKAYDFSTLPQSPEPTADIPNTTTDTAARPPGVRPRLVVIGPRRPADVLPPAEVEIDAFDTVPASVGAPPLSSAAAPPPVSPSPVPAVGAPSAPSASAAGPRPSESAPAAAPAPAHGRPRPRPKPAVPLQVQTRAHARRQEAGRNQREASARAVLSLHDSFAMAFKVQLSADGIEIEPNTLKDAMRRPDWSLWLEAMKEEMNSLTEMGTWVLEELPDNQSVVGSRWVFKLKLDSEGNVARYKARLVAQGFSQVAGVNYNETYSPVTRFVTIRTLFALAAHFDWHVHQLDVVTAYLYGLLSDVVYMRQPPGFEKVGSEHLFCRLRRALYGLKQSGREWYFTLRSALIELGFEQSTVDPAIFIFGTGATALIVAVYVDDVLVLSKSIEDIKAFKVAFAKRFKMTDQGSIGQFLGMKIERSDDNQSFLISQSAYIRSMLERFNMKDLTPIDSPLDPKQRLVPFEGEASAERIQMFQATIGCLNWLAQASRPDIAYAVATLARHCKNPGPIHFGVVKRVMRYLVATADYKFRIAAHSINDVTAYSDADFGGDFSAKSTSGYSVSVHGATVAWGAKLQSLVADSTAQAELIAVWQTTREVLALRYFLEDLGLRTPDSGPASIIYCDNQPALHIITNPVANGLTRHMERKYLSTRQHQERGIIDVKYVNTKANPADMFTKGLPAATFAQHREAIGLHPH